MRLSQVILASFLLLSALGTAAAEEAPRFVCTSGDNERVIEVVYNNPDESLPCEVRYHKDGNEETLWRAQYEEGFCEQQAKEFVSDQEDWGWECDEAQDADASTKDTERQ